MEWLIKDPASIWQGLLAALCILIFVILVIRVAGLRTLSKMTSFDFAVTIAMGSILGAAASTSITFAQGATALITLVALQAVCAFSLRKSKAAQKLLCNQPLLIMKDGEILSENMKSSRMSESELLAKLREANVLHRSQIRAVVLEATGDVSVLHSDDSSQNLEPWLLEGVATEDS